jgi:hypothetical protein
MPKNFRRGANMLSRAEPWAQFCVAGPRAFKSKYLEEQKMIGKGHPDSKDNAKELRKRGGTDDLFYATDSNLLFLREAEQWLCLGHVAHDIEVPRLNQAHPRLVGHPH